MMEMADYWLLEKDLVPKLFQVIVPRYADKIGPYTLVHKLPVKYPGKGLKSIVMELKENSLPPVTANITQRDYTNSLTNVLINSMRNDYRK
jgi:large subunit ribosomal protein L17